MSGVRRSGMELHSVSSYSKPIQKQSPLKLKPTAALVVQVFFSNFIYSGTILNIILREIRKIYIP